MIEPLRFRKEKKKKFRNKTKTITLNSLLHLPFHFPSLLSCCSYIFLNIAFNGSPFLLFSFSIFSGLVSEVGNTSEYDRECYSSTLRHYVYISPIFLHVCGISTIGTGIKDILTYLCKPCINDEPCLNDIVRLTKGKPKLSTMIFLTD